MLARFISAGLAWVWVWTSYAAKPELEAIHPTGAARGTTNSVAFFGKIEPWPPKFWASAPGISFLAETNKGKVQVVVSAEAPSGACLVRVFNEEGSSEPKFFVVGEGPELVEVEPNDHFKKPQNISEMPVTVNGRLDRNRDVDSYLLQLKAGQWLDAKVDSHFLMSTVDPVLRLVTTEGHQLAFNHDFSHLDPRLIWQAPTDMTVVLQVFGFIYPANNSVHMSGGNGAIYRLALKATSERPQVFPDAKEETEGESASELSVPGEMAGVIGSGTDEDRFQFEAKKGEVLGIEVEAAVYGSPLDAWLRIDDAEGKELARNDDANRNRDPRLEWTSPSDGKFYAVAGSLTHRGGPEYRYRIKVSKLAPEFQASVAATALSLKAGETNQVKINLKRERGHTNQLEVVCAGLPEGVTALPGEIPAKDGEVTVQLVGGTNAAAWSGPITFAMRNAGTEETQKAVYSFVSTSENNGVPGGYNQLMIENTDQIWLTVTPAPTATVAAAEGK